MSNSSFNLPDGLKVGPVTIDADTGAITTSGNVVVSGGGTFVGTNAPGAGGGGGSNVKLLLNMNGSNDSTTFTDSSAYARTVTRIGNTVLKTATKKYGTASAYFASNGNSLSIPSSTDFDFASGDFTIECWMYVTSYSNYPSIISRRSDNSHASTQWALTINPGARLAFNISSPTTWAWSYWVSAENTVVTNTWMHVAVTRTAGYITCYIDGTAQTPVAIAVSTEINTTSQPLRIGDAHISPFSGYIDDVRITKGQAIYTSNFIPPSVELTTTIGTPVAPSNVKLLLNMNGDNDSTTFTDSSAYVRTVTRGSSNTVLKTAQKKYGTASAYFDGVEDYITIPNSSDFDFGAGDFALECWVRFSSFSTTDFFLFAGEYPGGGFFGITNSGTRIGYGRHAIAWDYSTAHGMSTNTWYHIALTRSGTSTRIFINGTQVGTTQSSSFSYNYARGVIGYNVSGYIDDVRIIKGQALYTSNFVPPGAELTTTPGTPTLPPTYAITANTYAVNEGSTIQFTVTTTNVANSTVLYWTTSQVTGNITTADFSDSTVSGNVTITSNTATFTRTLAADLTTEGGESFAIQLRTDSISGNIRATSNTVVITDSSTASAPAAPTFVASTLPSLKSWSGIAYGDGKFVAVGGPNGLAVTANDGVSWSSAASPVVFDQFMGEYGQWQSVAYGNGKFVAVGGQDYTNKAAHSTDGSTWTEVTMPAAKDWSSVAFGGGTFVAASYGSPAYLAKSTDGINWTQIATFPALVNPAGVSAGYFLRVAYLNDRFYVFETSDTASQVTGNLVNNYAYSTNGGSTWTTGLFPIYKPSAMAYGNGTYVVLKGNSNSGSDQAAYSTNGTSWTAITLPSTKTWDSIAFTNGQFVAVGMSDGANEMDFPEATDKAIYSTDGINWTEIDMPSNKGWKAIAGGNNKFVVVATSMMGDSNSAART